jgi:hypothetical protein
MTQGELRGRIAALYLGFSSERRPFLDKYWRTEKIRLIFQKTGGGYSSRSEICRAGAPSSSSAQQQPVFSRQDSTRVNGADELDSMGSSKVWLENNSASSHEKRRRESS